MMFLPAALSKSINTIDFNVENVIKVIEINRFNEKSLVEPQAFSLATQKKNLYVSL